MVMEHRWGKRIAVELPVTVVHVTAKRAGPGCLQEISLGGALLVTPWELNVGATVQVLLSGRDEIPDALIEASVVRRCGAAIAIEWLDFAPNDAVDVVRSESRRQSPVT